MPSPTPRADWRAAGLDAKGAVDLPGHLPIPLEVAPRTEPSDGTLLRPAAPDGLEGEFDDRIDPRFPVFSAVTLAETLPGPLTPMTLDVQLAGLRAANRVMSLVMALGDVAAGEWGSRAIAVFGHRPYVGVSASVIAAGQLPGWDAREVVQQSLGDDHVDALLPLGRPPQPAGCSDRDQGQESHCRQTGVGVVAASEDRHQGLCRGRDGRTPRCGATDFADRTPDLQVRARLLRDRIHQGWSLDRPVADRHGRHRGDGGAHRPARHRLGGGACCWKAMPSRPRRPRWRR